MTTHPSRTRRRLLPLLHILPVVALLLPAALLPALAEVRIHPLFSDHAVLQADLDLPVWGWADPGEKVTVTFAGQTAESTTCEHGKWFVTLKPLPVSKEGREMKINDKTFKDILVGEVWVCSGQSNMEWTINASANPNEEAKASDLPLIRHVKIGKRPSSFHEDSTGIKWVKAHPDTVKSFTAVGFYFGRRLHKELDVPIGLLNTSWGGTRIEPWTPKAGFEAMADEPYAKNTLKRIKEADPSDKEGKKKYQKSIEDVKKWVEKAENHLANKRPPPPLPNVHGLGTSHQDPTRLYRGMVHCLLPYAIRGAIWYQGESNGGDGELYEKKLVGMIKGWREVWGQGDFPFYFVQLANYQGDQNKPEGSYGYARIREGMRKAQSLKNTGMAVIIDIGEARDIHPKNKQDVGKRLAQWALVRDYGKTGIPPCGPSYKSHDIEDGAIRIHFDHVGKGLLAATKEKLDAPKPADKLTRFAITGKDKKWVWADAKIDGKTIVVSSPDVKEPVAVRYAFSGNPQGPKLYNKDGIPASPFQTDDW